MANYAYNTKRVFIGDPVGISDIALRRRTDNMLSSALKFGTTEHIAPHPSQIEGDETLGLPPLNWTDGDDAGNIASLINVAVESLAYYFPRSRDATFDFATRTFRDSEGKLPVDGDIHKWAAPPGTLRAAGAGVATLKRSILLNTLLQASSGEKAGILEYSLRLGRQLVDGSGISRSFYALGAVQPARKEDSVEFREAELPADAGANARVLALNVTSRR